MRVYRLPRKLALILVSFCFMPLISIFLFRQVTNSQVTVLTTTASGTLELIGKTKADLLVLGGVHDMAFVGGYAYVATGRDLEVIDVSSPIAPRLVFTNSQIHTLNSEIESVGSYLYILDNVYRNDGLTVVDVANPLAPQVVLKMRAGIYGADASNLQTVNDFTYLLFLNSFSILDTSAPSSPVLKFESDYRTRYEDALQGNDFDIVGNIMYVAGDFDFTPAINVFDITVPLSPTLISRYKYKEPSSERSFIKVVNGKAYVADGNDFYVIDISDSHNLKKLGTFHNSDGGVWGYEGLAVTDQHAYLIYDHEDVRYPDKPNRLQALSIADPANPRLITEYDFSFIKDVASQMAPMYPRSVMVRDGLIYVGATDGLYIFRLSGNSLPTPTPTSTVPITTEPVIFVPGVTGSYLFEISGEHREELWPAASWKLDDRDQKHQRLTLDPAKTSSPIFATDILRQIVVNNFPDQSVYQPFLETLVTRGGFVEYQVNNDPQRRTEQGCDFPGQTTSRPDLFVFAYDWRRSNADSATLLAEYVGCIRKFYPGNKINIIAHSMGGLVARRYILEHPGTHGISKLITIGTPWLGTPKAIHALETGRFAPWFVVSEDILRDLLVFFPGVHQLLPSEGYFKLGGQPFEELGWDANRNQQDVETYSFIQMKNFLDEQFISKPASTTTNFHTLAQDDWRSDESGIEYHVIYGVEAVDRTIEQVVATTEKLCSGDPVLESCLTVNTYDVRHGKGDETVPRLSAERIGSGLNFNGSATLYHPAAGKQTHLGLTKNEEVQNLILQLLNRQNGVNAVAPAHLIQEPPTESAYYLRVYGAETPVVTDALGHSSAPINDIVFPDQVPGVTMDKLGENNYALVLMKDQAYTVTFTTSNTPFKLEITDGTGVTNTRVVRYRDVKLPAHANMSVKVTPQNIGSLYLDSDQNGSMDTIVTPTVDVSGSLASDKTPPVVHITHTQNETKLKVSIDAVDNTGVAKVYYSLDDTHFQLYSVPFTLEVGQFKSVYAFADDTVSNRSPLAVHSLTQDIYLPQIQR